MCIFGGLRSMDELFGDIKDLSDSLSRLSLLPPDFEGKEKVIDSVSRSLYRRLLLPDEQWL